MKDRGLNALFTAPRVPTKGLNIVTIKNCGQKGVGSVRGRPINHTEMSIATVCSGKSRSRTNKSSTETTGVA